MGVFWTEKQDSVLRKEYGKKSINNIAKKVGRTVSATYQRANKLGLSNKLDFESIKKSRIDIQRLNSQGKSDFEIADELGLSRRLTAAIRLSLGLKSTGRDEKYRERVAAKTKEQLAKAGVASLAELKRVLTKQRINQKYGWPDHLSLRAVQIVETLYLRGPMTRKQIAAAIGVEWRGTNRTLGDGRVPGGSYLAELQRAGLVIRLESAITGKGKGNQQDLYMVALEVEPCRKMG